MELLAVPAVGLLGILIIILVKPQWWIGVLVFLTFVTTPAFIPVQIAFGGFAIFPHEIALLFAALFLFTTRRPNRITDWCAAGIALTTLLGGAHGFIANNDPQAIGNDARGLAVVSLCVFIVGRINHPDEVGVALKAARITLWISFGLVSLGALGLIRLNARYAEASLDTPGITNAADVTRILTSTSHFAGATVAVVLALWVIRPHLFKITLTFFVPALGISIIGFSRNTLVLILVALALAPVFYWNQSDASDKRAGKGALRLVTVSMAVLTAFLGVGGLLYLAADFPGFNYLHSIYSAYTQRVISGFDTRVVQVDSGILYRQEEIRLLQRAAIGHEFIGRGFGYRYRLESSYGFAGLSGSYYAHNFYWWAIVKVGWFGLLAYMAVFVIGVANALFGSGRFALRSAAAATLVGGFVVSAVAPLPSTVSSAPVFGVVLGIALLRWPLRSPSRPGISGGSISWGTFIHATPVKTLSAEVSGPVGTNGRRDHPSARVGAGGDG